MPNILRLGVTNTLSQNLVGQTVRQILANSNFKSALGFGDNVQIRINGQIADPSYVVKEGETLDIETVANKKAADVQVTVRFGTGNVLTRALPDNTTVKSVLTNPSFRAVLGYGDNVVAKIDGALVRDDVFVSNGMVIDLETAANKKAV